MFSKPRARRPPCSLDHIHPSHLIISFWHRTSLPYFIWIDFFMRFRTRAIGISCHALGIYHFAHFSLLWWCNCRSYCRFCIAPFTYHIIFTIALIPRNSVKPHRRLGDSTLASESVRPNWFAPINTPRSSLRFYVGKPTSALDTQHLTLAPIPTAFKPSLSTNFSSL